MFEAEDSESENSYSEEVNIALLMDSNLKNNIFVAEALKLAVVDRACTKTVAGEEWYKGYVKDLPIKYKNKLQTSTSNTAFKFENGHKVYSFKKVRISANMGGTECSIDVEIVKEKIPLLLSKHSLKNAQAVIDIANDKVSVFDKNVDLYFSTSGHYCLNISPKESKNRYEEILVLENDLSAAEKIKIHKQFGHATITNMKKLLKNANLLSDEICKIIGDVVT